MLVLGGGVSLAYVVQGLVTLMVSIAVAIAWKRNVSLPARAAILIAATPIAVPIVMFYDLMLVGVAMAWLVRAGCESAFPPWHRTALVVLFLEYIFYG